MSKSDKSLDRKLLEMCGIKAAHKVEKNTTYNGERPSPFSFCTQFAEVIFRYNGSVIPNVVFEICFAIGLSFVAIYRFEDEEWAPIGHQIVGVLLAFLVVFRSQSAMGQYMEGRNHVESLLSGIRIIADEAISSLAVLASKEAVRKHIGSGNTKNAEALKKEAVTEQQFERAKRETFEVLRLLKLYYFGAVEHCRSTEGYEPWCYAQDVMHCECLHANITDVARMRASQRQLYTCTCACT